MLAVVGGSGFYALPGEATVDSNDPVVTPWGVTDGPVAVGRWRGAEVLFLARHGPDHRVPPHRVNYRANLWALHELGARHCVALNAVGGISGGFGPGVLAVPDQLIDYTWGRAQSYWDGNDRDALHVDFGRPFDEWLRRELLAAGAAAGLEVLDGGTYGVTQGPRLETAAEIDRMERDGCHMVGMTLMPEAGLARELELPYASLAVSVNHAAGRGGMTPVHAEIEATLARAVEDVTRLLTGLMEARSRTDSG